VSIQWTGRAVRDLAAGRRALRSPGGDYTFFARHDSIFVRGPERTGTVVTRFVGGGSPVVATRNGQYLLAVRRNDDGFEPVVYYFVLFHAMLRSSCDR
jgi:hypothetical protein